jgi:predicted kinase
MAREAMPHDGGPLTIVDPSLVLMIGPAGSGKSTLAGRLFAADEILSSDALRKVVSGDEGDQTASGAAFATLHRMAQRRLEDRRLTVIDATNLRREHRRPLLRAAVATGTVTVAIVLDLPREMVVARDMSRQRVVGQEIIDRQSAWLRETVDGGALEREGIETTVILRSLRQVDELSIVRRPI